MKLLSYNSIKLTLFVATLDILVTTILFNSIGSIVTDDKKTMLTNSALVAVLGVLMAFFVYLNAKIKAYATSNIIMDIHQKITRNILNISLTNFNKKDSGEYISLYTNDRDEVVTKHIGAFFQFFENIVIIIFFGLALLSIHYVLFLVSLITLALSFLTPKLFEKKYGALISLVQNEKGSFLNKIRELIQGLPTLAENNKLNTYSVKERQTSAQLTEKLRKQNFFVGFMNAALGFTSVVTFIISTLSISLLIYKGYVANGVLVSGALLMSNFTNGVTEAMSSLTTYKSSLSFIKEKLPTILEENEEKTFVKAFFIPKTTMTKNFNFDEKTREITTIELKNLSLKFDNDRELTFGDFIFEKGKKYALVGKSGAGKSTLLKILLGEVQNYAGAVVVDGKTRNNNETLFNALSYAGQSTYLFNDSIEKNITLAGNDENVKELLNILELDEFSLDYFIEENGKNLSGGQRQRIGLARALYSDHNFLILDEATSALDKTTRQKIENYILNLDKTVIMISHHLDENILTKLDKVYEL